jgi:hypothetical protein
MAFAWSTGFALLDGSAGTLTPTVVIAEPGRATPV